ncbi:MAG: hypothetical protein NVSMB27_09480 [Ktedonobacteraceae bacterium]
MLADGLQSLLELSAMGQAVVWLQAVETQCVVGLGLPERLDEAPGRIVGGTGVADLARAA